MNRISEQYGIHLSGLGQYSSHGPVGNGGLLSLVRVELWWGFQPPGQLRGVEIGRAQQRWINRLKPSACATCLGLPVALDADQVHQVRPPTSGPRLRLAGTDIPES